MLKSKWFNLVLDIDFMTLNILKLDFFCIFLELIINMRASSQNFVENHQFNVSLLYIMQNLDSCLFKIAYLHIICTTF